MQLPELARMPCPKCGRMTEPLDGSTWIVAWYACGGCDEFWSARLRDGRPVINTETPILQHRSDC